MEQQVTDGDAEHLVLGHATEHLRRRVALEVGRVGDRGLNCGADGRPVGTLLDGRSEHATQLTLRPDGVIHELAHGPLRAR